MPSDISKQIVQQIYSDDKSKAIDSINDALSAHSYDVIQAHKLALAQDLGFELDDTAQDSADEIAASMPDNTDIEPEEVDTTATEASAEQQPEDTPEEENETDS